MMRDVDETIVQLSRSDGRAFSRLVGRLRFKHLSLLVALGELRNLHRAATAVHLAQPSASKLILDLERSLGHALFSRLPTGMHPTELGTVILAFAQRTLCDLKRIATDVDSNTAGRDGCLVVSTNMDVASEVVIHAMAEIKERRPTLSVKLLGETSEMIVGRLLDGQTDMAIGYISDVPEDGRIDYEEIGNEILCVVARQHHPLCRENHLTLAGLKRAAWVLPPFGSAMSVVVERCLTKEGMKPPADMVEANSVTAILGILLSSDAVTILPESVVCNHIRANLLVRLSASVNTQLVGFGVLTRQGETQRPVAMEFTRLLQRHASCVGYQSTERCYAGRSALPMSSIGAGATTSLSNRSPA